MKISVKNTGKVDREINKVEGSRSRCRLLSASIITSHIKNIEARLAILLGGKNNWRGVMVDISENFGTKPSSYNGRPCSTFVRIERFATGWFVTRVDRCYSNTNMKGDWEMMFNKEHENVMAIHIQNKYMTEYGGML